MTLVLLPILIWSTVSVIVPETMTTLLSSPETAVSKAAKLETVVVVPPEPPVVPPFKLAKPVAAFEIN